VCLEVSSNYDGVPLRWRYHPPSVGGPGCDGGILLPHVASLGFGVRVAGDLFDVFPFFVTGVLHLISGAVLAFGGIYHSVLGPEVITCGWFVEVGSKISTAG